MIDLIKKHLSAIALLALFIAVAYKDYILQLRFFSSNDFINNHYAFLTFESDCINSGSLPLWNPFINFGYPWLEHYLSSYLLPTHLLLSLFTRYSFAMVQYEQLLWIFIGATGVYLCALQMNRSARASLLAALAYTLSGPMIAINMPGNSVYSAACIPFAVYGYHLALRNNRAFSPVTIFSFTLMILGGYVAGVVVGIYIFLLYTALDAIRHKQWRFMLIYLALNFGLMLLLVSPKIVPFALSLSESYRTTIGPAKELVGNIWFYDFLSLLLPAKYFFSLYAGALSIVVLAWAAWGRRLRWSASIVTFIIAGALLMAKPDGSLPVMRDMANAVLPLLRLVRLEYLYWYYPVLFLILYCSEYFEDFLAGESGPSRIMTAGAIAALTTIAFFTFYSFEFFWLAALMQTAVYLCWGLLYYLRKKMRIQTALIFMLVAVELIGLMWRVDINRRPMRARDSMILQTLHQNNVPHSYMSPVMSDSPSIVTVRPASTRPAVDEARASQKLKPFWGMFGNAGVLQDIEQKTFSGKTYNVYEKINFTNLSQNNKAMQLLDGIRMLDLIGKNGESLGDMVSFDRLTCSEMLFSTSAAMPADLVLYQMHDKRWRAYIDGDAAGSAPLIAGNYFMTVPLGAGNHSIRFVFRDRVFEAAAAISALTLCGILGAIIMRFRATMKQRSP